MCPSEFDGPDELAQRILDRRAESAREGELPSFGKISDDGVRRLVRIAYYGSQAPNEGRYPRLTLLVPACDEAVRPLIAFDSEDLNIRTLCRLGPTLASQDFGLLVTEREQVLKIQGITQLRGPFTQIDLGDATARPLDRPSGLYIEVFGPGDVRARELNTHRLQAGKCRHEQSFMFDGWFRAWVDEAASELFRGWRPGAHPSISGWNVRPDFLVIRVWLAILRKAASLRHGGCFVILPDRSAAIRPAFATSLCDVGMAIVEYCEATRHDTRNAEMPLATAEVRRRTLRREHLLSLIDVVAHLSQTDGCVVFNRRLQLQSVGSMIEVGVGADESVPCYKGDSTEKVNNDEIRHSYGARRRSAIQLCRDCPGALAFVISQDGDVRIFVRIDNGIRLFDNAVIWTY
jgi:hypothetical protein